MARFLISKSGVSGSIIKRDESEWSLLDLYRPLPMTSKLRTFLLAYEEEATQEDRLPATSGAQQRLVAIANRLELDVEEVLDAEFEDEV